jgi:hypothetical protein
MAVKPYDLQSFVRGYPDDDLALAFWPCFYLFAVYLYFERPFFDILGFYHGFCFGGNHGRRGQ